MWDDWIGCTLTVGIYVVLGSLSWWGAYAWASPFMFAFGCIWWLMALVFSAWFIYVFRQ